MGSFRKQRDRICEVPSRGLDQREACEDEQRNEEPALAGVMRVTMRTAAVTTMTVTVVPMPVPVGVVVAVLAVVLVVMRRVLSPACVLMVTLMIARVWHEVGNPVSGYILETL